MGDTECRIERRIDLPRSIVWHALVEPTLVEGWLDPVERLLSGTEVLAVSEPGELRLLSPEFGQVEFSLESLPGGTRNEQTRLIVTVASGEEQLQARWELRLDQLENLLRGHPVDWSRDPSSQGGVRSDGPELDESRYPRAL